MNTRSGSPRRGLSLSFTGLVFTGLALVSSAACSSQQPATQGTSTTAAGDLRDNACSTGPLLECPEGQLDGCANGTTTEHRCVAAGRGRCLDIRAALVKCLDGEILTHDGCPEPAYMKRCAPRSAQLP